MLQSCDVLWRSFGSIQLEICQGGASKSLSAKFIGGLNRFGERGNCRGDGAGGVISHTEMKLNFRVGRHAFGSRTEERYGLAVISFFPENPTVSIGCGSSR